MGVVLLGVLSTLEGNIMSAQIVGGDKLSNYRIDASSLPVFFHKLRLINPTIEVTIKQSAYDGKVVVWSEDHQVKSVLRRILIAL